MRFIFCDYLDYNDVICNQSKHQLWVLVSDKLKDEPEKLVAIEEYIINQAFVE